MTSRYPTADEAEWITAAAVRVNGLVVSLPPPARHCDIVRRLPGKMANTRPSDQGFVTNTGHFIERGPALDLARTSGQLLKPTAHRELFSEDLW